MRVRYPAVLRIRDVYPGSRIVIFTHPDPGSHISDPGSRIQIQQQKREGWKKICCHTFFCSHKFHIIENYFIFEMLNKKIWANFQRIIELLTQKIVTKLSKIWVWDPGSRIQGSKKDRIQDPDPGWKKFGSGIRDKHPRSATLLNCWISSSTGTLINPNCFTSVLAP